MERQFSFRRGLCGAYLVHGRFTSIKIEHVYSADGMHVKLPITHGEMTHMVGMARKPINRIWNHLRRDGVLSGERDTWVLHLEQLNHGS